MSFDFDVTLAPCDHRQLLERYILDQNDFKTLHLARDPSLNLRAPLNNKNEVEVFISGVLVDKDHENFGYEIKKDTNLIDTDDDFSKIMFKKPLRYIIPLIEVSYFTNQSSCAKCSGFGKLNDFKKGVMGSIEKIKTEKKLAQRCLKFLLSSSCPFYPTYTCLMKSYIGKKFGSLVTENDIAREISVSLEKLKQVQNSQRQIQSLDPGEILKDVINISVKKDAASSLLIHVQATVTSFSNKLSPLNFSFRVAK